jgi:hypothetical protein
MPLILKDQPIPDREALTFVAGEQVRLRADQIVAWVQLRVAGVQQPAIPPFPAILDSGFSHFFAIQERHLNEWAGRRVNDLRPPGSVREGGQLFPLYDAHLEMYANIRGRVDRDINREPMLLDLPRGIIVYPTGSRFPRLPLVGLRTIIHNRLRLTIAGDRRRVDLKPVRHWIPFLSGS